MRADALAIDDAQDDSMVVVVVVFLLLVAFCYGNEEVEFFSFEVDVFFAAMREEPIFCSRKIS